MVVPQSHRRLLYQDTVNAQDVVPQTSSSKIDVMKLEAWSAYRKSLTSSEHLISSAKVISSFLIFQPRSVIRSTTISLSQNAMQFNGIARVVVEIN